MTCHFVFCLLLLRLLVLSFATLLPQVSSLIVQLLKYHVLFYSNQHSLNILIYQLTGNIDTYINNYKVINNDLNN